MNPIGIVLLVQLTILVFGLFAVLFQDSYFLHKEINAERKARYEAERALWEAHYRIQSVPRT